MVIARTRWAVQDLTWTMEDLVRMSKGMKRNEEFCRSEMVGAMLLLRVWKQDEV